MKKNKQRTSDYFIIKLRYYASAYWLKQWHEFGSDVGRKKHFEAAQKHNAFFWKFFEHVTGKTHDSFVRMYAFGGVTDCAIEELEAEHELVIKQGEGWYTYLIPKTNTDLIQWFIHNTGDIPTMILKKVNIFFDFHQPTTWKRKEAKEHWDKFKLEQSLKETFEEMRGGCAYDGKGNIREPIDQTDAEYRVMEGRE